MAPELADAAILEKMHWTWAELQETPEEVIVALLAKWQVEQKHQEEEMKKTKQEMERARLRKRSRL